MSDKLPDGVVLEMQQVVYDETQSCLNCYFLQDMRKCPTELRPESGDFTRSCTNDRDIIFREIGESDE